MADKPVFRLGQLYEHAYFDCLGDWRTRYAPSVSLSDLLAGPVASVETQMLSWPAGLHDLVVTIHARRAHESTVYFFRVRRLEPTCYRVERGTINL